jgi:DNA-binding winged helix-turn-helix (wHTH) protein/tetratricopeptide (TPR) repeat protein
MANVQDRLSGIYRFDRFTLDIRCGMLLGAGGEEIPLRPKSFAFLLFMLERAGTLVSRETIMEALWPNIYVTDDSLTQCVHDVRHALGGECRHLLRTISGRGYIFNPRVQQDAMALPSINGFRPFGANKTPLRDAMPENEKTPDALNEGRRLRLGSEAAVRLSVLVMPLRSLCGSDGQERLAHSVTGDIVTDLRRYLKQMASGEAQILLRADPLAQLLDDGGGCADYVLRGSVQGTTRPSVNLQLLNVLSGVCLWAERCVLDFGHGVIAGWMYDVAVVLVKDLARRIDALPKSNLTPRELVLRGRAWLLRAACPADQFQALRCFERALAMQPDLVGARFGIAASLIHSLSNGWSHAIEHDEARAEGFLLDALQADMDMAAVHGFLGTLRRLQGRLDESLVELELAIRTAPHVGMTASQIGMTHVYRGRPDAALPHFEAAVRATAHDVQRPLLLSNLGTGRLLLGDVNGAIEVLREATAAAPQHSVPPLVLAAALALRSAPGDASAALRRAVEICPSWGTLSGIRNWIGRQATPDSMLIHQQTLERGLQRAGMPEG